MCGKFEAIVDRRHHLDNGKWAMPSGCKLCGWLIGAQVVSFKPHLISDLELGHIFVFDP